MAKRLIEFTPVQEKYVTDNKKKYQSFTCEAINFYIDYLQQEKIRKINEKYKL